jgi:signal transduction histidine kinase/ActR/RegA family two-component response regulator
VNTALAKGLQGGHATPRRLKWVLVAVLLFLAGVAVITSCLIVERQESLQRVSRYNLSWLLSQAANETLRVVEVVAAAAVPGTGVDSDDVGLRVDILENRLGLLLHGEADAFIRARPPHIATVAALRAGLEQVKIHAPALPEPRAAIAIRAALDPLVPRMLQLAAAANSHAGDQVGIDQAQLGRLHWTLTGLMFAILTCAAGLAAVFARVRERLVDQLTEAKVVAEQANAAKSQFLANISHDLRTPLNGLLGMVEALSMEPLQPRQARHAASALRSGKVLLELISGILDFSRIEARRLELEAQPFSPQTVLHEVEELLGGLAQAKGLALALRLAPDLPPMVVGDAARLRQILINIVGNAIKFTSQGHIVVAAAVEPASAGGVTLRFAVRDTGIGIPGPQLAAIFDPFAQVDGSNTRRFGGAGLGLSIARELVGLMGGQISVESVLGVGSTFTFTVLFGEAAAVVPLRAAPAAMLPIAAPSAPPGGAGMRVLVVDDSATSREVARFFLEQAGCLVAEAEDGRQALARLQHAAYDLILMDRHMPEMDGVEATRRIRRGEAGHAAGSTIIGLSAGALQSERDACLQAGMDGYLTKPVSFGQIGNLVRQWMPKLTARAG